MKRLDRWHVNRDFVKRLESFGLTQDQIKSLRKMDRDSAIQWIAEYQADKRSEVSSEIKEPDKPIPEIGREIQWFDIVEVVFRVLEFDRNGTILPPDGLPKDIVAKSKTGPYGYLLVESPILNQPVGLPIIHHNDFWLASSVFDDPTLEKHVNSPIAELLVTYAPKKITKHGYAASPEHVLHFVMSPRGTLERYYPDDSTGDRRMRQPEPQLVFGPFVYEGEIKVQASKAPGL